MSIRSEHPPNADQIFRALVALGAEPVLDPDVWPEGPQEEDRLELLGALLARVELEITAATRLEKDKDLNDVADTLVGWMEQTGPAAIGMNVLIHRMQRTAVQLMGPEEAGKPPAGRAASAAAVVAVADLLSAARPWSRSCLPTTGSPGTRSGTGRCGRTVCRLKRHG